jgi:alpha-glucosidase
MLALPGSAYLYQGEELGLPEHTVLDDELRQDPAWWRSGHTERGRDGCRVPLPWAAGAPGFGFSATGATWLPQPASWAAYALDAQRGVAGSTYETYRAALALRRELDLGTGSLESVDLGPDVDPDRVLALVSSGVLVLANLAGEPVALPAGATVLLASGPLGRAGSRTLVRRDTTVWARLR